MVPFLILFILAAILSAASPIFVKMYINSQENKIFLILLAIICSIILIFVYIVLTKQYGASRMYSIVKILSILMVAFVGFLFLGDKITVKYVIGILLACVALYLLCCNPD